ncbi:hypothetical protein AGMMS49975_06380 [Clostridia bacterium]|nr:hypothetical protein AGMMS49975_06380 [Clostridia bacterium]
MTIAWIYLDKKTAAVDAMKDFASMDYIIENSSDDLEEARSRMTAIRSSTPDGMPRTPDPHAGEARPAASLDEIDVLKERYRRALEYMEWFRPAWDALTDDEQFILTEFFLREDISKTEVIGNVSDRLHIERSWVYKKKDAVLTRLPLLLYGK